MEDVQDADEDGGEAGKIVKETVQEAFSNYQVDCVNFSVLSSDQISRYSEVEVLNYAQYDLANERPFVYGPLDLRMGSSSKNVLCSTCGKRLNECVGHFGHVSLALPVFHAGYLRHTHQVLASVCKSCARLLLAEDVLEKYKKRLRRPQTDDLQRQMLQKRILHACKSTRACPHCGYQNSSFRKGPGVPLILRHAVGPTNKQTSEEVSIPFIDSFNEAKSFNKDLESYTDKASEDFNPLVAYELMKRITPSDREILGFQHPEQLLLMSVSMGDKGTREDDLTMVVGEIVEANSALQTQLQRGLPRQVLEAWEFLQEACARYVNSEISGLTQIKGKSIRSICTRLKGKEGRFRGNLSGKRVDFSGRTVISPDPNISVEQVVIPEWVAKRMTFPEKVCEASMSRLKLAIMRGPEEHPGACFVRTKDGRTKFLGALGKQFRKQIAESLKCGDLVERHMRNGDVVLFNRQPSLHRLSIMAHRAKVMPGRTFRFNECVCAPYNADFDGDEMNIHLPQTEEARAEAMQLMGVRDGLVTPKSGEVAVCATQDFLTGAFLLTQKDVYLSRDKFCQLCCFLSDGLEAIDLPPPAIIKPCELWTGKQAISVMLRPNRQSKVFVNLEVPEKNYSKKNQTFCCNDGYVLFRNSELLSGNLGKKVLGGAKNGLFFRLIRDSGARAAMDCMSRIAKLTSRWLMNRGFTIGIDDVNAEYGRGGGKVTHEKQRITREKYETVANYIGQYNKGTLENKPGCNAEQTLEALVNGELGRIRDLVGGMCEEKLAFFNKPRIMATCGSKGSPINLCQMMACVGQQNVGGQRIKDGFVNRTLPHFPKGSKEPKSRGFVANSFYTGLEPPEFFFHTMGGREGLVDTAVKTAETGYMQRRLMKALEDLALKQYDLTVRTSNSDVVQFAFGDAAAPDQFLF
ncbi:DNA-directed RNA polymerase III subunit rpc1 [Symbiodinium microadriaticum]|uniref:DNA-directed RNA polymerase subunit n=1 Tax=Symbiodinium microadriaticum TaxID=2951 RepID=A0A1Q9ERC7_SYMMI|nr:DNA-directed RNA polymerase III subunit rpc1 [Symbiodinium microadriaticum]